MTTAFRAGDILDGCYRLVRALGEGGFAAVFEAEECARAGRRVAVKVLDPALARRPKIRARFVRETEAIARLDHPHILPYRGAAEAADGALYCVMDLSPGETLRELARREGGRLAVERAVALVAQVLEALDHAHARGVVHRDVKPENVLVEREPSGREVAKVIDFGLAKLVDEAGGAGFTTPGAVLGSFEYLAPEQAQGLPTIDGRADQYAAAIVLYELCAGVAPFAGRSSMGLALAHVSEPPPRLGSAHPDVGAPPALDEAIARALAKSPDARFPGARAFREALEAALAGAPPAAAASLAASARRFPLEAAARSVATVVAARKPPAPPPAPRPAVNVPPRPTVAGERPPADRLPAGFRLGKYVIEEPLGGGGMGMVYRARHARMQRVDAVKVIQPEFADDETVRARFLRESQVASRFRHPSVVELYDCDEVDGLWYIAMELVDGLPLRAILDLGPLPLARVAAVFDQLLDALAAAHEGGVVHRDLKPGNIMIGARDEVHVLDFGIARMFEPQRAASAPDGGITRLGEFVGTPAYAAPEQINGAAVDGRTDLYQAGVILFEALAGQHPLPSSTPRGFLTRHILDAPASLVAARPDLPGAAALDAVVARALAKEPADRFQSAAEMRAALIEAIHRSAAAAAGHSEAPTEPSLDRGRATPLAGLAAARPSGGFSPVPAAVSPVPASASPVPASASPVPASASPVPGAAPFRTAVLAVEGARGLTRLFLVAGPRLAFGRSRDDPKRGIRNDVVLRVLPARDPQRDAENWAASGRISNAHGEFAVDGVAATVVDRSARGTVLDGAPLARDRATPLPEAFEVEFAERALRLAGRIVRGASAERAPASLEGGATSLGPDVLSARVVDALVLRRTANVPEHAYALVPRGLTLGRAPAAAVEVEAPGVAALHARLAADGDGFAVEALEGRVLFDGHELPPGARVRLAPGVRLRIGEAELTFREAVDADFTTV